MPASVQCEERPPTRYSETKPVPSHRSRCPAQTVVQPASALTVTDGAPRARYDIWRMTEDELEDCVRDFLRAERAFLWTKLWGLRRFGHAGPALGMLRP